MIHLARRKWWLVLAVIAAELLIGLTIGHTLIRWELNYIREAW